MKNLELAATMIELVAEHTLLTPADLDMDGLTADITRVEQSTDPVTIRYMDPATFGQYVIKHYRGRVAA